MALRFAVRGNSLTPRFNYGPRVYGRARYIGTDSNADVVSGYSGSNVLGGSCIAFDNSPSDGFKSVSYFAGKNFTQGANWTMRLRMVPSWTGSPSANQAVLQMGWDRGSGGVGPLIQVYIDTLGRFNWDVYPIAGGALSQYTSTTYSFVSGDAVEIQMRFEGSVGSNRCRFSINGVEDNPGNPLSEAWNYADYQSELASFIFGACTFTGRPFGNLRSEWALNEFLVYDSLESVAYTIQTGGYTTVDDFNGDNYTDPTEAKVARDTSYVFAGVTKTGTALIPADYSNPGQANVSRLVTYKYAGSDITGTAFVPADYSDPGEANVLDGVAYEFENVPKTGTALGAVDYTDPGVANVTTGVSYLYAGVNQTGTRNAQTYVIENQTVENGQIGGSVVMTPEG